MALGANGRIADLPELAADLVRNKVEIIVARESTNFPILAAMKATQTIPIVMLNGNFPVEMGLVQSLARPGRQCHGHVLLGIARNLCEALSDTQGTRATHRSRRCNVE